MAPSLAGVLSPTLQQMESAATTTGGMASRSRKTFGVAPQQGLFVAEDQGRLVALASYFQALSNWSGHQVSKNCIAPGT